MRSEKVTMRPEMELLLHCARPEANQADEQERLKTLLSEVLDWEYLIQQAFEHCIAALLYWRLRSYPDLLPRELLERLSQIFQANFRRNLLLTGELVKILDLYEAENIPALAYKGPVLGSLFNENLGLRDFGDLDILVRSQDVPRAEQALLGARFRPYMYKSCPQEDAALPFARAFHFEMSYISEDSFTSVDLHWALMPGFFALPAVAEEIWNRALPATITGRRIRTLAAEDLLLIVCAHGTKHIWERLGWIRDVACIVAYTPGLDWNAVFQRASQLRIRRPLCLGLALATDLMGARLPEESKRRVDSEPAIAKLAGSIRKQLFENASLHAGVLASCGFFMRSREDVRDAVRCCVERTFQPTLAEWAAIPLPRWLFSAYYLLRPVRLAGKHGWEAVSGATKK